MNAALTSLSYPLNPLFYLLPNPPTACNYGEELIILVPRIFIQLFVHQQHESTATLYHQLCKQQQQHHTLKQMVIA